ncbi:54S ribosomal protein L27 [Colletotrichum trifolii]|uniref:54S ribosomal protein L27 n=1 Tax=Colletotrichum trifolii TaxID=5466 RepID=A0A4R8R0X7_COLTR|nr:54S ribosomal protein L27 [Colletotrichum trifolii]
MRSSPILQVLKFRHNRLTTKDVNKGFYKGNRTGSMGRHTKHGGYMVDWSKVRTYIVPNLAECNLTPFVPESVQVIKTRYNTKQGPRDPVEFLRTWKEVNGVD